MLGRLAPMDRTGTRSSVNLLSARSPVPEVSRSGIEGASFWRTGEMDPGVALGAVTSDATLYAIVSGASEDVSRVEWRLYRKAASGKVEDRTEVPIHPALTLWNKPNTFFTGQEFREAGQQHHELTGEWYMVLEFVSDTVRIPRGMWLARPDRMTPVKDHDKFLVGWIYQVGNEKIPLTVEQVIQLRRPSPTSSYRGMAGLFAGMSDVETNKLAAAWARNFFHNDATPGGVIEFEAEMSDEQFRRFVRRWRDAHKGVNNAHRVGIIEGGKWVDRKYTIRDMQFTELRAFSSEQIRIAYRYPKAMLGTSEDVNRANAEAAEYIYARNFLVPRLDRIKSTLNNDLLPIYEGDRASDYEFDYVSPVPHDYATAAPAVKILIDAGFDAAEVLDTMGLPPMQWEKPTPLLPVGPDGQLPVPPGADEKQAGKGADDKPKKVIKKDVKNGPLNVVGGRLWVPRAAADLDPDELPPLAEDVQSSWQDALDALVLAYGAVTAAQILALAGQVRDVAEGGDVAATATLAVSVAAGVELITPAMVELAALAVQQLISEADEQGVELPTVVADPIRLGQLAESYADILGRELTTAAAGETARLMRAGVHADDLVEGVTDHLDDLTEARPRMYLGGALTAAQNAGRTATLLAGPTAAYYANEVLDKNTCAPCREVNGRWLGNSILKDVLKTYPTGGYVDCKGRLRCRGMVSAIWRPATVEDDE